jgi:ketosteroid isomerase-like protein
MIPFVLAAILLSSCQQNTKPVDKDAAQKSVAEALDNYDNAIKKSNTDAISPMLTDDGLFIGTDPGEFWNKAKLIAEFGKMSKDSTLNFNFAVDKREIRLSPDGMSALCVEQYVMPAFTKMPVRITSRFVNVDGQWKIDFISWNFITENKNIAKLNELYP